MMISQSKILARGSNFETGKCPEILNRLKLPINCQASTYPLSLGPRSAFFGAKYGAKNATFQRCSPRVPMDLQPVLAH